jgi:hypothetical protein
MNHTRQYRLFAVVLCLLAVAGLIGISWLRPVVLAADQEVPDSTQFLWYAESGKDLGSPLQERDGILGGSPTGPSTQAITSTHYVISGGSEMEDQTNNQIVPAQSNPMYVNSIFASGTGDIRLASSRYQMQGTVGEPALPPNTVTLASASYMHRPGFLAAFSGISGHHEIYLPVVQR